MIRILVTGSREWDDPQEIENQLVNAIASTAGEAPVVLVHGACPFGADSQADRAWRDLIEFGTWNLLPAEKHPGDQFPSFKARNQHMVDLGASVCLAFATKWASGTGQTARMARKAGIKTLDFGVDTSTHPPF